MNYKTITKVYHKTLSINEFNKLRNKLIIRAEARTRTFKDNKQNYYWYQIEDLNRQFPEFRSIGKVIFK